MKVNKETAMFRVLTGSRLYGTATDKSDFDYKVVCLPSLDDLLMNKKLTNRKEKPEGTKAGDKMLAGETETEYLPLQVFMDDFFNGQTYALEMAFAVRQGQFEVPASSYTMSTWVSADVVETNRLYEYARARVKEAQTMMNELIDQFLTRNVKKMVGYAVSQSKLYGLKTERYTALKDALFMMNDYGNRFVHNNEERANTHLTDVPDLVEKLLKLPHVKTSQILNTAGGTEFALAIDICGKQHALTNKVAYVVNSVERTLLDYGERVKSFDGQGVDWKALSHAIRITEQVLELSQRGTLVFPRPNADFLRAVKNGEKTLDEATDYLNDAFAKVDDAVATSVLQEKTPELESEFQEWKLSVLRMMYDV